MGAISSFQDKALQSGLFLIGALSRSSAFSSHSYYARLAFVADLLSAIRKRAVDYSLVTPGITDEDKMLNAKYAINVARK